MLFYSRDKLSKCVPILKSLTHKSYYSYPRVILLFILLARSEAIDPVALVGLQALTSLTSLLLQGSK